MVVGESLGLGQRHLLHFPEERGNKRDGRGRGGKTDNKNNDKKKKKGKKRRRNRGGAAASSASTALVSAAVSAARGPSVSGTSLSTSPNDDDNWVYEIMAESRRTEEEDEEVEQLPPLAVLDNVAGMEEAIGGPRPPPRPRSRARAGYPEKAKEVGSKIRRTCVERKGGDGPAGRRLSQVPTEVCDDRPPPGSYTCRQQAEWGKCDEEWLVGGGYCARSCGRCEPRPLYLFLAAGLGLSSALATGLEGSSREMPQAARSAGNGRRQALQAEGASPESGADSDSQAFVVGYQGADGQSPQFSIGTLEGSDLLVSRAIGAVLNAFDISTPEEYCSEGRRSLAQAPD